MLTATVPMLCPECGSDRVPHLRPGQAQCLDCGERVRLEPPERSLGQHQRLEVSPFITVVPVKRANRRRTRP